MRYDVVLSSEAARAPDSPEAIGYLYNPGGLNNQKMAFVGLLMSALAGPARVNVPYLYIKDQRTNLEYLARYQDVFQPEPLFTFAERHAIGVDLTCPSGERGGWSYFNLFALLTEETSTPVVVRTLLTAVTAVAPRVLSTPGFQRLKAFVFASLGIQTTIQLRVERDWQERAEQELRPILGDSEDYGIGFVRILTKVKDTFPDLRLAYVTADEASLPVPKQEIRDFALGQFGIRLVWKSDLINPAEFNALDLSLIDFEIAKYSPRFIGTSFSTFSNLVCLEKFAKLQRPVTGHFIYNHPGDRLMERRDNGFMGISSRVVSPNLFDAVWAEEPAR